MPGPVREAEGARSLFSSGRQTAERHVQESRQVSRRSAKQGRRRQTGQMGVTDVVTFEQTPICRKAEPCRYWGEMFQGEVTTSAKALGCE